MFDFIFLISAIIFVTLDYFYLNLMKGYFEKQIQSVQGSPLKMNFLAAIICYIFLIFGLNYFIIKPKRSVKDAFLFGLIIYAVYETTNKTLLTKWSWTTVFIDSLWGGVIFALTTGIISKLRTIM